ncbi:MULTISPECIES: RDD family protein [Streptomyces]|uniref:RDD family protein n=1 Tax=Streptomyces TaxID=1883 RepID=UPI000BF249C8|nr:MULTISPECIES: RDD family protein [unclassified Streptomyces]RDL02521.1 putative RDD family membrane protein YckC [Streptomyces sp. HB202]UIZ13302.1 RDD family protein [Streptomyces sp. R527F]
MSELVTGDAVVLGLRPARLPSRALASAIDLAVTFIVFILVSVVLGIASAALDEAAVAAIGVASFLLVLIGGPVAVETLSRGRSLGKLACGLRVVRDDGGPIRFRHALVRGAMGLVEILLTFGAVASIASLVSARGRRIGDVFAGTLVIRERVAATGRSVAVPPPPPWLVGRFAELDLSGVPDELWSAIRQYLTRMQQLDPGVGRSIAERLAGELVARTGAAAPQGVPAAAFLAAVVHERQSRDARRVFAGPRAGGYVEDPVARMTAGAGGLGAGAGAGGAAAGAGARGSGPVGTGGSVGGTGSIGGGSAGAGSRSGGGGAGDDEQRRGGASSAGFAPPG